MKARFSACVLCALVVVGCTKKDAEPTKTEPDASASVSASAVASAPPSPSAAPSGLSENTVGALLEKLAEEQKNRPTVQPTVETVFDTVAGKLAIPIENKKQVAGFTSGARYCAMAVTKHDVHLAVCEFTDAAAATKGAERTSATNKVIKRREVLRRNATTLAIQQSGESKEAEAEAKKIHDAFNAL